MRMQLILGILVGREPVVVLHTRDISSTPRVQAMIGKTVKLRDWPQNYNVFAPTWHSYFINTSASYCGYPMAWPAPSARLSGGN